MNRRSIFTMLATAVAAAAQTFRGEPSEPDWRQCADPTQFPMDCGKKLAKNNQCPVCGTMAEPYHRPTEMELYSGPCAPMPAEGNRALAVCRTPSDSKLVGPVERMTRCRRCNAAFWQDAEEKRK